MTRAERAQIIMQRLAEMYPDPPIPLDHCNEFTLLVAVLLSAQCTDKMVNRVTPKLWRLADNPFEMRKQSVAAIQEIIRPCGLSPRKAKSIRELSDILVEKHNGKVPSDLQALEQLPGVGHKTASVVLCQAFGIPAFPVDTHIHRTAQRWKLSNGKNVKQTELDLKRLFPRDQWCSLHVRMIYYSREHCSAYACDGTKCELCRRLFPKRITPVVTKK